MDSRDELLLKEVNLHEMMNNLEEDVCKNGSKDCCDSEMKLLCTNCYWSKVQDSVDAMEALDD